VSGVAVKQVRLTIRLLVLLVPFLLVGCGSEQGPAEYLFRQATVESVEVEFEGPGPMAVNAIIKGTVAESCAQVDEIRQEFDERARAFTLTITTRRPVDEACLEQITPFEATIPLPLDEMPDGVYTVIANGVTVTFRLERPAEPPPE
jgi:hypothetical protein